MKVRFDPEALAEAEQSALFYEREQPGLGYSFVAVLKDAVSEIVKRPLMWRKFSGRFRRYLLPKFPFGIIYTIHENEIYIAAIMHTKRKPGYWKRRG